MEPGIGSVLRRHVFWYMYTLNYIDQYTLSIDFDLKESIDDAKSYEQAEKQNLLIIGPRTPKSKPKLFAYFIHSIPWRFILAITAWTTINCLLSFQACKRELDDNEDVRWWISFISVDLSVGVLLSIDTFSLLGLYMNSAFMRYYKAGTV